MTRDQASLLQSARRWHRRLALVVAAWLALLALTGSAINRAHDWGLDRATLPGALQRAVYGVEPVGVSACAGLEPAPEACAQAFARLATDAGSLLLAAHGVTLLDAEGRPLESLSAGQLGLPRIDAGLAAGGRVYLQGGERVVAGDPELLELAEPTPAERAALDPADWRRDDGATFGITWERLLLDLHAARFLGPLAQAFTDLMAATIVLLVLSGAWLSRIRNRNGGR